MDKSKTNFHTRVYGKILSEPWHDPKLLLTVLVCVTERFGRGRPRWYEGDDEMVRYSVSVSTSCADLPPVRFSRYTGTYPPSTVRPCRDPVGPRVETIPRVTRSPETHLGPVHRLMVENRVFPRVVEQGFGVRLARPGSPTSSSVALGAGGQGRPYRNLLRRRSRPVRVRETRWSVRTREDGFGGVEDPFAESGPQFPYVLHQHRPDTPRPRVGPRVKDVVEERNFGVQNPSSHRVGEGVGTTGWTLDQESVQSLVQQGVVPTVRPRGPEVRRPVAGVHTVRVEGARQDENDIGGRAPEGERLHYLDVPSSSCPNGTVGTCGHPPRPQVRHGTASPRRRTPLLRSLPEPRKRMVGVAQGQKE